MAPEKTSTLKLRAATQSDLDLLWPFLALAARKVNARAAKRSPRTAVYLKGWKRPCDFGFVAEKDGQPVGAAWARIFSADETPSLSMSLATPTLCIAVTPSQTRAGAGGALLAAMKREATDRRADLCLLVNEGNPARRLYERAGFRYLHAARFGNETGEYFLGMHWVCTSPASSFFGPCHN